MGFSEEGLVSCYQIVLSRLRKCLDTDDIEDLLKIERGIDSFSYYNK
ncbi:hypothetical protein SVXHx_2218 [Haloferax volcanii]|nr:hypothetical protein SVXHx_2218 [Haloferax lucentense]